MANVLILLTLPEPIRNQYRDRLRNRFPGITIELVDHHSKVGPYIGKADALITFAPMLSSEVLAAATRLKWVQALGTGVDNLIDQPALRQDVIVTIMRAIHGAPVSEAALAGMLALARELRRAILAQDERQWRRFPAQLLHDQDGRHIRRRPDRRDFGTEMQGFRHARGWGDLGAAQPCRVRPDASARRAGAGHWRFRFPDLVNPADNRHTKQHRCQDIRSNETDELSHQSRARRGR